MYDRATVQGATFNMRGQLYRGHANATAFSVVQLSVHWAPSRTTRVLVLDGARRCALETCKKKNALYVCCMHALCSGFYYAETKIPNFKLDRTLLSNLAFDLISGVQRGFSSITSQA